MKTDAKFGTANQRLAFEAMAFDILDNLLRTTENPATLSTYLAEQLRELTGARTVLLLQCVHDPDAAGHRVVAVNPERRRSPAELPQVARLAELADDLRSSTVWGLGGGHNGANAILAALGCGLSIAVPLRVGKIGVGVMLLLDLPDAHGIDLVVEMLDMLSTVVALVFRNALLYEEQEAIIEARTCELRAALEESRRRSAEMSALLEGARAVLEHREFMPAARAIFDSCKKLLGATAGYVALLTDDRSGNEVLFLDPGGLACTVDPSLPMPVRGLREQAYRTDRAVYENDFLNSEWAGLMPKGHVGLENVLFAPLVIEEHAVGLLGLANKPGGFTENDARMAQAFGKLVAIVLLNSRTLESLENSEERFRSVAHTAGDAIIAVDSRGTVVFCNQAAERMFGYSAEEVVGQSLAAIIPERFRERHQQGLQRVVSTGESRIIGKTVEVAGLRRDGSEFPMELSLATWKTRAGEVFFTGFARDVTERRQAEEEIRRRTEELAALNAIAGATSEALDMETILHAALREVVIVTGVDGAECHLQDSAGDLVLAGVWGLDDAFVAASRDYRFPVGEGIPGRTFACRAPVYVADASTDQRYLRRAEAGAAGYRSLLCVPILGRESLLGTFMLYSRPPREFAPEMWTLLMTVGGQLAVALERARLHADLQAYAAQLEQRVAERTAELQAANQELEAFAYSVSHDLRAPLRAIDGFAQALQEDYADKLDADGQHYLERLRAGSQQMGQLIDDLLHLSRVSRQELERRPLDLAAMARRAFEDLAPYRAGREIDFRVSACPPAHGDAHLMALVVHNLLSNAIKFTREREPAIIEFGYQTEGPEPAYFVCDNGVGFDMTYAGKLFAPFQRLHRAEDYPGTGIGLAIVHRVIHRHGGRVRAEAAVNRGATFYFAI